MTNADIPPAGLCTDCLHRRIVRSARGSTYLKCGRSDHDDRYPKFPRLPVLSCPGHQSRDSSGRPSTKR